VTSIRSAMQHNEWWLGRCTALAHTGVHGDAGVSSLRGVAGEVLPRPTGFPLPVT
jgi:hypothetical protein